MGEGWDIWPAVEPPRGVGEGLVGGGSYKEWELRSLLHLRIFYWSCPRMGGRLTL